MGTLFDDIRAAVEDGRYIVGWHADERCEERGIAAWQVVSGIAESRSMREQPRSQPNPYVVVRQMLADGVEVEAVWAWLAQTRRAMLVTVFFPE